MQRILTLLVLSVLLGCTAVSANAIIPGVSLVPSTISGSGYYDISYTMRIGYGIGGNFEWALADRTNLLTGLNYETRGAENSNSGSSPSGPQLYNNAYNLGYLQVPVLFEYKIMAFTNLVAGPELAFLLNADRIADTTTTTSNSTIVKTSTHDDKAFYNAFDLGLTLGANYLIQNKILVFGGINIGLLNIANDGGNINGSEHNYAFKIGVGYRFDLK